MSNKKLFYDPRWGEWVSEEMLKFRQSLELPLEEPLEPTKKKLTKTQIQRLIYDKSYSVDEAMSGQMRPPKTDLKSRAKAAAKQFYVCGRRKKPGT